MKYYYARVSSETQNLDRQVELFKEMGANDRVIFQEKKSGKSLENREVWNELLNTWIKSGDIIIVKNLDRIGRNAKEVRECILNLAKQNIILESIDQGYLNDFLKEKLLNKNATSLAEAMINVMLDTMLEGDYFIVMPKVSTKLGKDLTVCYYCDNLHPSRKTYAEVN